MCESIIVACLRADSSSNRCTLHRTGSPKEDYANRTGSRMHVFLARPRSRNVCCFSTSTAGASEENFSDFGDAHRVDCVHVTLQGSSVGARPLKRLERVRYTLRSNESVEANSLENFEEVKTRTPSTRSRGQAYRLGPSSTAPRAVYLHHW